MKETLKKIFNVCKFIFSDGVMIVLFASNLTFFDHVATLIIGEDTATVICICIYRSFVPVMIETSTILILFSLLIMYLVGEKALIPRKKRLKIEGEK